MFNRTEADASGRSFQLASVIGTEATIVGDVKVTGSLRVDGDVAGDVTATQRIQIGRDGTVNGDISAVELQVAGTVDGSLSGELVHLTPEARISGSVRAARLIMEEGATLDGTCAMTTKTTPAAKLEVVE